jgi:hypothetical protein
MQISKPIYAIIGIEEEGYHEKGKLIFMTYHSYIAFFLYGL